MGCSLETIIGYMCVAWVVYIPSDLHFCLLEEQPQKDEEANTGPSSQETLVFVVQGHSEGNSGLQF